MKKILIAVDDSPGSTRCVETYLNCFSGQPLTTVTLLHVQQFGGITLMHDRISETDVSNLKDELKGSDAEKLLDKRANAILQSHKKSLESNGVSEVKTIKKSGHVAEEIVNTARDEGAEMIIIGHTRGMLEKLLMGNVTKDVSQMAEVPVLLVK